MSDLTDLEICRKIAEIEHIEFYSAKSTNQIGELKEIYSYNPLTNAAIWSPLIEKYKLQIDMIDMIVVCHNFENGTCWVEDIKDSLAKAICLAIIKANKEKS